MKKYEDADRNRLRRRTRAVRYSLRDSRQNIVRHPLVLVASVTTVALMLLLMSFYAAFSLNASHLVSVAAQQPPVQVTMDIPIDPQRLVEMDQRLAADERVLEFEQYTPGENMEQFKSDMNRDELFEEESLVDIFPYTYSIRLQDPSVSDDFQAELAEMPGVHTVRLQLAVMEALDQLTRTVNRVGIIAFVVLAVISILVVGNMVRVSVLNRATEIGIMKYVGATNLYVRIPFIVEGLFAGFLGAIIATVITALVYRSLNAPGDGTGALARLSQEFALLPASQVLLIVLLLNLVTGLALCVVASLLSVKRHINV